MKNFKALNSLCRLSEAEINLSIVVWILKVRNFRRRDGN